MKLRNCIIRFLMYTPISPQNPPKVELSNIHSTKKIEKEYINTSINDIYKKYTNHFQDFTRDLLDAMVEFVRWCPYLEIEPLKFVHDEMLDGNEENCIIRILIYISSIP